MAQVTPVCFTSAPSQWNTICTKMLLQAFASQLNSLLCLWKALFGWLVSVVIVACALQECSVQQSYLLPFKKKKIICFLCCADSEATAKREIEFFFPEFNMEKWFQEMGNVFSAGQVEFNSDTCEHVPAGKQMPAH